MAGEPRTGETDASPVGGLKPDPTLDHDLGELSSKLIRPRRDWIGLIKFSRYLGGNNLWLDSA